VIKGIIYKIANDINSKVYIGQTRQTLKKRLKNHKCLSKTKDYLLYRAIRKYGWKHFTTEVVEDNISLENLNEREIFWTNKFNALTPYGYVCIAGGELRIVSEETRRRMSKARLGNKNPNFGKHHTEESKKKISKAKIGQQPWLGKKHSEETKQKMKRSKYCKNILCYDLDGNFIKEFDSIHEASRELNLYRNMISKVCRGLSKYTGNYIFKYYE
jgi:group I intron endonuclease